MKRIILTTVAVLLLLPLALVAQKGGHSLEQVARYKAVQISRQMEMSREKADAFIPVYEAFQLETGRLMAESRKGRAASVDTDEQAEKQILADFATSRSVLEIRERYYQEFKKILTPLEIRQMYVWEKKNAQRSLARQK